MTENHPHDANPFSGPNPPPVPKQDVVSFGPGSGVTSPAFPPAEASAATSPAPSPVAGGRKKIVAAGAGGLSLLLAGGAFAAYQIGAFGAVGPQPAEVVPASAFAYASIDFNPSAKEKVGAYQFAKKFPSAKVSSVDTLKEDLISSVLEEDGLDLNYDTDLKGWLGDRAAVAALPAPGTEDGVTPLLVLHVTDQEAAKKGLRKIEEAATAAHGATVQYDEEGSDMEPGVPVPDTEQPDRFAYAFSGDYVLISDVQKEVDAAATAEDTLDANTTFKHDMATLGDDQFARAWIDADGLVDAVPDAAEVPAEVRAKLTGSFVIGAHADADYVEVTGHAFGVPAVETVAEVALADRLPADTTAAVEVTGLGASLADAWTTYQEVDMLGIAGAAKQSGFKLPEDLLAAFGTDFAAAVKVESSDGKALLAAKTADPKRGAQVIEQIAGLASVPGGVKVTTTKDGYTATTDEAWSDAKGSLVDTDSFQKAVAYTDGASAFGYLNIADLVEMFGSTLGEDAADAEPIDAIGFVSKVDGDSAEFTFRLTTK